MEKSADYSFCRVLVISIFSTALLVSNVFSCCGKNSPPLPQAEPRKLVLISDISVCDEGTHEVDDGYALAYVLGTPSVELLAFVASFGNTTSEKACECVKYLLQLAGREDIPVFCGASGIEERWKITEATEGIRAIVKTHPGEVWIASTGTATDLAAFLYNYPDTATLLAGVLLGAGVIYGPEGILPADIVNVALDPPSADYVLAHAPRLVVAPLDLTEDVIFTYEMWKKGLQTTQNNPFMQYILLQSEPWVRLQSPIIGGFYPFDAIGLGGLFYPSLITSSFTARLEVSTDPGGPTWTYFLPSQDTSRPVAEVWLDINEPLFLETFLKALGIEKQTIETSCNVQ